MKFNNLIEAVKAVREVAARVTIERDDSGHYVVRCGVGLKDSKDLAEAIMALGVRRFLEVQSKKTDEQLVRTYYDDLAKPNNW